MAAASLSLEAKFFTAHNTRYIGLDRPSDGPSQAKEKHKAGFDARERFFGGERVSRDLPETLGHEDDVDQGRKVPTHEVTYAQLRDMILFGALAPGQPVTIQGLIAQLNAGMTPVREAIRRLAAEGALMPQGNRRVSVPQMSVQVLEQLAYARLAIEPQLARLAAPKLTDNVIAELRALDDDLNLAIGRGDIPAYLRLNHAFHFTLYEAAQAPVLLDIARSLWLRAGPSLRLVMGRFGGSALPDLHAEALVAMRAADGEALAAAIGRDIAQGVDEVRLALAEGAF